MANQKISSLTALTGANVEQLVDVVPIVDGSASATKKILVSELSQAMLVIGTAQATTSGTEKDFTIPAWAKRVTVSPAGVSTNGTSSLLIQLGDAGGIELTGYVASTFNITSQSDYTTGFGLQTTGDAAVTYSGAIVLCLVDASTFTWSAHGSISGAGSGNAFCISGIKSLSAALTTVRFTTFNGTDAFDAGKVNVLFE